MTNVLKEKHFEIYIKKLSRGDFPKVRLGNRDFEWSFFIDRNGEIDREMAIQFAQDPDSMANKIIKR